MKQMMKYKHSMYLQLIALLLVSFFAAAALFFILTILGDELTYQYLKDSRRIEAKDNKAIEQLQEYVGTNDIAATDEEALFRWEMKETIIFLEVYRGDQLLYSSFGPGIEGVSSFGVGSDEYLDFDHCYPLEFADGEAEVYLYGNHRHKVYQGVQVLEFGISFLAFIIIFLIGIHRIIRYICKLRDEIEILEGGNLDYEITVQGKNELSELANSLNSMRASFSEQIKTEISLRRENKALVSEVSHDIRTPLTVLLLYAEALRHKKYKDQQQMEQYIQRIDDKAKQIQKLADSIFEYSLKEKKTGIKTSDTFKNAFFNIMSEMIEYLGEQGYEVETDIFWKEERLCVSEDSIRRIMDNIVSNICKYAEPEKPVVIEALWEEAAVSLSFSNFIRENTNVTGTKIGLKNITSMMESMEGECRIGQSEQEFKLTLVFPLREA